jgi:hypothetical protein
MPCLPQHHALVVTYTRPWRNLFRKVRKLRCHHCDMQVSEPLFLRNPAPVTVMYSVMGKSRGQQ